MTTEERLPPNYHKLETALRSIGYSFEAAVADIIDNSVDWRAKNVLVRLIIRKDGQLDLAIVDDGSGMEASTLREAMRFGSDVSQEIERLGKFGLGLKLASLSQAKELRVLSIKDGKTCARGWLEHGIKEGFTSTVFDAQECRNLLNRVLPDRQLKGSGTLVAWSHLYRLSHQQKSPEEHAQKLLRRLEEFLALAFHRFLSGRPRKVNIALDIFDEKSRAGGIPVNLDPLDPFGYDYSGSKGFPMEMSVDGRYKGDMKMVAHIWPPNSKAAEYKLPGGTNSRQGFYFYRNHRLIQGGGWNGIREVEPHSSLARIEVDLSPKMDLGISLDVKKISVHLPPDLASEIERARTPTGIDFKKYLALAQEAYRTRPITESELPLIPSLGLPAGLSKFLHRELRIKATAKHRDLKFRWKRLDKDEFFLIDRPGGNLYLNAAYRKALLKGGQGSSADAPVIKCLLFLVLEEILLSERNGPRIKEKMEQANRILVEAVRYERSAQ